MSEHWMRCRLDYNGDREWAGTSEWSVTPTGSRVRTERRRTTYFTDERAARRWARKYRVDFPVEAEPRTV